MLNKQINNFKHLNTFKVPEYKFNVHQFKHNKAGTNYFHLERDDNNKAFTVFFNTSPSNSSGLSHILEHTVLCGSKRYPIRDPFFNMLRRSQSTFMNAMTGYDYTTYPFSTFNNVDYFNLLSVYADAVFNPILREEDFMQEGWRLEPKNLTDKNSPLEIKGIVYNEMKGVFSDFSNAFMYKIIQSLMPETYGFISGGDPKDITSLTWKQLKDYHRKMYSPKNATLVTYGNVDLEAFTHFFDKNYFSKPIEAFENKSVPLEPLWNEPRRRSFECAKDPNLVDKERDSKFALSYRVSNVEDVYLSFKMNFLSSLLMDGETAPLYRKLISESQLALDWSIKGFDNSSRTTSFHIGLEGVKRKDFDQIENVIHDTLSEYVTKQFPKKRIDGLLHSYELSMKNESSKFGLKAILSCSTPIVHKLDLKGFLCTQTLIDKFQQEYSENANLFGGLIAEYLLNNPHKLISTMSPSEDFESKLSAQEEEQLKALKDGLTKEELSDNLDKCHRLAQHQMQKEDVSILPCLKIDDIPPKTQPEPFSLEEIQGVQVQLNEHETNGMVYFKLLFDLNHLPRDLLPYVPLFSEILTRLGNEKMSHLEFSLQEDLVSSGISNSLGIAANFTKDNIVNLNEPNLHFYLGSACLERNVDKLISLFQIILTSQPNWHDTDRIMNLINMYTQSNWSSNALASQGHSVAMTNANSRMNTLGLITEQTSGLFHAKKVFELLGGMDANLVLLEKLREIFSHVFKRNSMRLSLNGDRELIHSTKKKMEEVISVIPVRQDSLLEQDKCDEQKLNDNYYYSMPYQVHYISKAIASYPQFHQDYSKMAVLAKIISSKYLHPEIREKGGAYGGGCMMRSGSLTFYSYRDPNFERTLDTFTQSIKWATKERFSEQDLFEAKLSLFNSYDQPVDKKAKGNRYFFKRITDQMLDNQRGHLMAVTLDDLNEMARRIDQEKKSSICVLGPKESIDKAAMKAWTIVNKL